MSQRLRSFFSHRLVRIALLVGIWVGIFVISVLAWYGSELPGIIDTASISRQPSVTVLAEDGSLIARYGEITGTMVKLEDLPPHLVHAVLAVEDRRFYYHFGIDPIGLIRAITINLVSGRAVQGGSTITQQLAKNLFLTPEKSLKRKIQEAMLAIWLEAKFTKDEILTSYLNRVYLGGGAYGVDAAAKVYYNKGASQLTLRESATIAGLLKAPTRYSPANNPGLAAERAKTVIQAMIDAGFLKEDEAQSLKDTVLPPRRTAGGMNSYGRYFADWVMDQVTDYIGPDHGDIIIQTTLRSSFQKAAESAINNGVRDGAAKHVTQGAAIILSPDGAIRAMVGGKDWNSSQFNRAVQAKRQPGSSFKPVIYLSAIENAGFTPETLVEDAPISIGNYAPDNYTTQYEGWVPMREALAKSLNTVAVRLLHETGIPATQAVAKKLGLPTPKNAGLSYALGTSEVTLLQLTSAYASFANGGMAVEPYGIIMIRAENGRLLWKRQTSGLGQVAPPQAVAMLVDMMKGVVNYGTGTAAALPGYVVAGKTGTSQSFRDAWFMGFTADYIAGVWMGNDDNSPMKKVTGGSLPAHAWKNMMQVVESSQPARPLATDSITWNVSESSRTKMDEGINPLVEAGLMPADESYQDEMNPTTPANQNEETNNAAVSDTLNTPDVLPEPSADHENPDSSLDNVQRPTNDQSFDGVINGLVGDNTDQN